VYGLAFASMLPPKLKFLLKIWPFVLVVFGITLVAILPELLMGFFGWWMSDDFGIGK
jgi:hypothetical protein